MSKFFTPTNEGRVAKMVDMVAMLEKSALSNKATTEEIDQLFEPLLDAMRDLGVTLGGAAAPAPQPLSDDEHVAEIMDRPNQYRKAADGTPRQPSANGHSVSEHLPLWASVQKMAEQAPLDDLGQAVIVYARRLEDTLFTIQDRDPALSKENKTPMPEAPEPQEDGDDDAWD